MTLAIAIDGCTRLTLPWSGDVALTARALDHYLDALQRRGRVLITVTRDNVTWIIYRTENHNG